MTYEIVIDELDKFADPLRAQHSQRYFKTGKGEYAEGDVFIGNTMPQIRSVCRNYRKVPIDEIQKLLNSEIHEHRMAGVIIMTEQAKRADPDLQIKLYDLYLKNVRLNNINNWDLVDVSAKWVVGKYLHGKSKDVLYELANSDHLWSKRTALLSTFAYLDSEYTADAVKLSEILVNDKHDLIHKAVGWTMREIGARADRAILIAFLNKHAVTMPRTALRYAIEHLPETQRQYFLNLKT